MAGAIGDLDELREAAAFANEDDGGAGGAGGAAEGIDREKHPSGIVPQLQNVVATVNLGVALDLKKIALQARNAEYNPKVGRPAQAGGGRGARRAAPHRIARHACAPCIRPPPPPPPRSVSRP